MADDTKRMNVLYSSDDNYAQHMGVSIYSLLRHNAEFENIRLYVIDNDISPENRDKLREMVSRFSNAEIMFLPFLEWKEKLRLNMSWDISISSYARLFVGEMLPETVDRVLYADCDMIVCEPLRELWNTPLDGKVLAAVQGRHQRGHQGGCWIAGRNALFQRGTASDRSGGMARPENGRKVHVLY